MTCILDESEHTQSATEPIIFTDHKNVIGSADDFEKCNRYGEKSRKNVFG